MTTRIEVGAGEGTPVAAPPPVTANTGVQRVSTPADPAKPPDPAPVKQEERPKWLPEKFKSAEDLAKSYAELESKLGTSKPADPVQIATQPDPKALEGVDLSALSQEYAKNGGLTEESLKKLEAKGITKEQVSVYAEGQKALAAKYVSSLAEAAGGQDALKTVIDWAGKNLSADEAKAANAILGDTNRASEAKLLVEGLKARFTAANGQEPSLVGGTGPGGSPSGVEAFTSSDAVLAAFRDPRYKTDEEYRKNLEKRLDITKYGRVRSGG